MLGCRSEVVREYRDGSIALMFRLTHGRFLVGYALGDDGMFFRGELLTGCDEERARHEALALAEYWSGIDAEDEADPWHGEPDETATIPTGEVTGGAVHEPPRPDTTDQSVNNNKSQTGATT